MAVPDTHSRSAPEVLAELDADSDGLSAPKVNRRREKYGPNEFTKQESRSSIDIFVAQFDSVLIWVLLVAAALSLVAGHAVDAVLIAIIVVANGIFGFLQDYRAEQSLESLRELTAPTATVHRDGELTEITATELVPGDIVSLTGGDVVPADGRVLEKTGLEVDESALTGESLPVSKTAEPVAQDAPLAERKSMVYKGTNVTRGSATVVVTATGDDTEMGSIASELAGTEETATPLQRELDRLGRNLGLGVVVLAVLVVPLLVFRGTSLIETGLTAVSLAVAAVPEGLPAVVTLTLALGVRRMVDENALVRRLPAVEALGSVDVICTDKTGTLTEGQMTVTRAWVNNVVTDLDDVITDLDEPDAITERTESDDIVSDILEFDSTAARIQFLFEIAALCNDAIPDEGENKGTDKHKADSKSKGDPTERALVRAATDCGIDVETLRDEQPRTDEIPFSSERKWMGTIHEDRVYVKGAPETVLSMSAQLLTDDGPVELTAAEADRIRDQTTSFADDALRVLAVAYAEDPDENDIEADNDLVFVGLVGMLDPAREEVADAIAMTRSAGIDVKMITGDNVRTAAAIAGTLGMGQRVMEGRDVEAADETELRERVEKIDVFARASPDHKVRILRALQANGHVVAMTGDGVNDAPALKNADVGVAMGVRGTDVAKQASDVVLLDDNYATIERAVERGRAIFDNVWKFVAYLLSANIAEVAIVFLASLFGYLVLPAVQLLWINLLTDGLPALALGADPESGDVMVRPPRDPDRGIIDREMLGLMTGTGTVTTAVILGLMFITLAGAASITPYTMTMVFTGFVLLEFGKLYVIRWLRDTPTFSNPWLAGAVGLSFLLQLAVLYTPLTQFFGTVPLGVADWAQLGVVVAICVPAYIAVATIVKRTSTKRKH